MQPACLGQRPTLVNTQGPIRLRHAYYVTVTGQRAAAASQLTVKDLLPAVAPTDLRSRQQMSGPICTHFWKNVIIFVTTTPIDINPLTQHMSCIWSSRVYVQIWPSYDSAFRRKIDHRQNKQTLRYLVDIVYIHQI